MKQKLSTLQSELFQRLADGQCYSGNWLGKQLQVSRTAIWKNIQQLIDLGLPIARFPQQGYQLTKTIMPLDEERIRYFLQKKSFSEALNFHLYASVNSTSQFLKELAKSPMIEICCAEKQTQGRGRFGRPWMSPFGENIYFSSRWQLTSCLSRLSALSLVVSLALWASLPAVIQQATRVKWPNDLLWNNKKLAGILIEVLGETHGTTQVIIGVGLNVNTATQESPLSPQPWCSLYEITGKQFDRNQLIANLIWQLHNYIQEFLQADFRLFMDRWQQVDYLNQQWIEVSQAGGSLKGKACGVNELGQLCLKDTEGKTHYLSSGDTSLKPSTTRS